MFTHSSGIQMNNLAFQGQMVAETGFLPAVMRTFPVTTKRGPEEDDCGTTSPNGAIRSP
jgi:hypothetical protein